MPNPFAETDDNDSDDLELARQAKSGDRDALERLVSRPSFAIIRSSNPRSRPGGFDGYLICRKFARRSI
jgi:hypothetical protein